jgi:hypothetical protein
VRVPVRKRPLESSNIAAVALTEVFGLFSLPYGVTNLLLAAKTHDMGDAVSHALS